MQMDYFFPQMNPRAKKGNHKIAAKNIMYTHETMLKK